MSVKRFYGQAPLRIDLAGAWTDIPFFSDNFGGKTINAAINIYAQGSICVDSDPKTGMVGLEYSLDFPTGSGLGSSGSLNVLYYSLINYKKVMKNFINYDDRVKIALAAHNIERDLGSECGKQDQFAAVIGGINIYSFSRDKNLFRPIAIDREGFEKRILLVNTGVKHSSSDIISHVVSRFENGNTKTIESLFYMKDSVIEMNHALEESRWEDVGVILTKQFESMKSMSYKTTCYEIENIIKIASPYIYGAKPGGAGGGGCVILFCKDEESKDELKNELKNKYLFYDIELDMEGIKIWT